MRDGAQDRRTPDAGPSGASDGLGRVALADHTDPDRPRLRDRLYAWKTGLLRSRRFQNWAARTPFAARVARKDGEALFDLVAGFLHSQVLMAFVELDLAEHLSNQPRRVESLALLTGINPDRMRVLCTTEHNDCIAMVSCSRARMPRSNPFHPQHAPRAATDTLPCAVQVPAQTS